MYTAHSNYLIIWAPSVEEVCRITEYKERLIVTLDQISIAIDPVHDQLDGIRALCQEIDSHPMFLLKYLHKYTT